MVITQFQLLILAIVTALIIYVVAVIEIRKYQKKQRALRALYFNEHQNEEDAGFSTYAEFCRESLRLLGVNIAEQRKKHYMVYGRAGLATDADVAKYLFFNNVIKSIIYVIAFYVIASTMLSDQFDTINGMFKIIISAIVVFYAITGRFSLDKMAAKRKENLTLEFPDAVDLLLVCVESGMGLDAALGRVCKELNETHPHISGELQRTKLELGVFGDRVQALLNLAERTDIQSFRSLVSALVQTEKYGTNLASTLRVLAAEYRSERLLIAEQKAAKVGALLTLPIVIGVFFPAIFGLILGAPIVQIVNQGGLFGGN